MLHKVILDSTGFNVGDLVAGFRITKLDRAAGICELEEVTAATAPDLSAYLKATVAAQAYQAKVARGNAGEIINATENSLDVRLWPPVELRVAVEYMMQSAGIAAAYDPDKWYNPGNVVSYGNALYVVTADSDFRGVAPDAANASAYWSKPYPTSVTAYAPLKHVDDANALLDTRIDTLEARKEVKEAKNNITGLPVYSVDGNILVQPHELQDFDPFNTDARLSALENRRINLLPYAKKVEDLQPVADRVTALEARKEVKSAIVTATLLDGSALPVTSDFPAPSASGFNNDGEGAVAGATSWTTGSAAIGVNISQSGQPDDEYEISAAFGAANPSARLSFQVNGVWQDYTAAGVAAGTLNLTEFNTGNWRGATLKVKGNFTGMVGFNTTGSTYIGPVIKRKRAQGYEVEGKGLALLSDIPATPAAPDLTGLATKAALAVEAKAREDNDAALLTNITSYNGILLQHQNEIAAEATSRTEADTALGNRVTALENKPATEGHYFGTWDNQAGDSAAPNGGHTCTRRLLRGTGITTANDSVFTLTGGLFKVRVGITRHMAYNSWRNTVLLVDNAQVDSMYTGHDGGNWPGGSVMEWVVDSTTASHTVQVRRVGFNTNANGNCIGWLSIEKIAPLVVAYGYKTRELCQITLTGANVNGTHIINIPTGTGQFIKFDTAANQQLGTVAGSAGLTVGTPDKNLSGVWVSVADGTASGTLTVAMEAKVSGVNLADFTDAGGNTAYYAPIIPNRAGAQLSEVSFVVKDRRSGGVASRRFQCTIPTEYFSPWAGSGWTYWRDGNSDVIWRDCTMPDSAVYRIHVYWRMTPAGLKLAFTDVHSANTNVYGAVDTIIGRYQAL